MVIPTAQRGILRLVKPASQGLIGEFGVVHLFRYQPNLTVGAGKGHRLSILPGCQAPVGPSQGHCRTFRWAGARLRGLPGAPCQAVEVVYSVVPGPAVVIDAGLPAVPGEAEGQRVTLRDTLQD